MKMHNVYLIKFIISGFLLINSCYATESLLEESINNEFLGTIAGNPKYVKSYEKNGDHTYAREYDGGADDLRIKISQCGHNDCGKGYKRIGEDYSYTPWYDGQPFSSRKGSMPGGGFFLTIKELDQPESWLNCFAYALWTYGKKLEEISGMEMSAIHNSVSRSIDHIIASYFECVTGEPQDGDLVIYQTTKEVKMPAGMVIPPNKNTHAGIYRKSRPNWNSPRGGTVESKWGWSGNPFVFQSDVFFVPHFYGDLAKFYRLKKINSI